MKKIKQAEREFKYFFDFAAFLKGDLSDADLLFCDGIKHLSDTQGLNLTDARLTSELCEKFGIAYLTYEADEELLQTFPQTEANEKETALILKESRELAENSEEECWSNENRIRYISDLHLNQRIQNAKCKSIDDVCYTMQKIVDTIVRESYGLTLIAGDVASDFRLTDSNLNHTGIYLYSKGKIMIHLTFDYKTDEKCTTPGQYLKYHRTFQGFTTRELAEKVGIVPATLVLYENDRHPIKHSTAVALANALGIDRNRLLDKYTAFVDYPYSSLLKKVRQELSLTQMQMAEVIGIGQTSYSGWEREIRVPRRKEYEKILAALKKLKVNVDIYLCHPAST